jgi:hypothetical protein
MAILDRLPGDFLTGRSGGASLPVVEDAPQVAAQAELHLCEGVWREAGPDVALLPRAVRGSGTVAILVEFRERPEVWACRMVVEAVSHALRAERGSLTRALAQGLEAAHSELLIANASRVDFERVAVGASCAILQDGELLLAQVGPAVAFAVAGHRLKRFTTLAAEGDGAPFWLGECGEPEIRFSRQTLGAGDLLLLATSTVNELPTAHWLMSALADGAPGLIRSLRLKAPFQAYLTALALEPAMPTSKLEARNTQVEAAAAPVPGTILYLRRQDEEGRVPQPLGPADAEATEAKQSGFRLALRRSRARSRNSPAGVGQGSRSPSARSHALPPNIESRTADPVSPTHVDLERVFVGAPAVGGTRETERPATAAGAHRPARGTGVRRGPGWRWWLGSLLLLPFAFGLGAGAVSLPGLMAQKEQATIVDGVREARARLDRADALVDPAEVRRELSEARRLLDRALAAHPEDEEAAALRAQAVQRLQRTNREYELRAMRAVGDLSPTAREASITGLAAAGASLYALDGGVGAVYRIDPTGQDAPVAVARRGEAAGGAPVGLPFTVGLVPARDAEAPARTLLVDANRNLVEMRDGGGLAPLKIRGAADLASFRAVDFYQGNLYVLDPRESQIWRYLPTFNGYDSERKGWLDNVDIHDAITMSIDGDIFILEASGRVRHFSQGRELPFALDGLDRPLLEPTGLYAGRPNKSLYIADTGNRRIVQLDKDGHYLRQFPLDSLNTLRGLYVDEPHHLVYFADSQKVYAATLPD